ncbi:MAG: MBL fold metallo-hydrolase [Immundisolibacteraceae bacterium]|nr:MBL fold metallo-hydrolase [Immundisolibacteraceae bacterium]
MAITIKHFFHQQSCTYSYVVTDEQSRQTAIIDPVLDFQPASGRTDTESAQQVIDHIRNEGLDLKWILETHAHADHLTGARAIQAAIGGQLAIGENITQVQTEFGSVFNLAEEFMADARQFDHLLKDGEELPLGESSIRVLATPGHTPSCVSYLIDDALFCGDTLFMPDFGTARCDFPGGDAATLYDSIQRLLALPGQTRMFMCHDYAPNGRDYQCLTSVEQQLNENIHIGNGVTRESFVAMRSERDATLSMPALILPSLQVNIRAGDFPPVEGNGVAYLKIPLNAF